MKFMYTRKTYHIKTFDDLESAMRNMDWRFEMTDDYNRYMDYQQLYDSIVDASEEMAQDDVERIIDLWHAYATPNARKIPDRIQKLNE